MMKLFPLFLYFLQSCCHELNTIPAPVNVTLDSDNFKHVLRWNLAPGAPSGTAYKLLIRREGNLKENSLSLKHNSVNLSKRLSKSIYSTYTLSLQAVNGNASSSFESISFTPHTDTIIGPPDILPTGCGNCLKVNISLPKGDGITPNDSKSFYPSVSLEMQWRLAEEEGWKSFSCPESRGSGDRIQAPLCILPNLLPGKKYCVRVLPKRNFISKTRQSGWLCAFTSIIHPPGVEYLAARSVGVSFIGLALLLLAVGLTYTGYLCKLKTRLPQSLMDPLESYYLTPEQTVADSVCVIGPGTKAGKDSQKQPTKSSNLLLHAAEDLYDEEEDEDEDEVENCVYMDREAELPMFEFSACEQSQATSIAASLCNLAENSGNCSLVEESASSQEDVVSCSKLGLGSQAKVLGHTQEDQCSGLVPNHPEQKEIVKERDEGKEEREGECFQNVNLLSVTLGALEQQEQVVEEEEEMEEHMGGTVEHKPLLHPETIHHNHRQSCSSLTQPLLTTSHCPCRDQMQTDQPVPLQAWTDFLLGPQTNCSLLSLQTDEPLKAEFLAPTTELGTDRQIQIGVDHRTRCIGQIEIDHSDEECDNMNSDYMVTHTGVMHTHNDSSPEEQDEEYSFSEYMIR